MRRREFLAASLAAAAAPVAIKVRVPEDLGPDPAPAHADWLRTYASPADAMRAPREPAAYVAALYVGTGRKRPDYLATVDLDAGSPTVGRVIDRLPMPTVGDELHHFGWNMCSSCHGQTGRERKFLIVPGFTSGDLHVVSLADPRHPRLERTISGREIARRTGLGAPHTVHCTADGTVIVSMLGDGEGRGPGGFLLLDESLEIAGRWDRHADGMRYNYDFWYQPRHNVMVSSEWADPRTFRRGFDPKDVEAGRYGRRLCFWDWTRRRLDRAIDLGPDGKIPLEVRFHHDPASTHGFVGAALSSAVWHWHRADGDWVVEKVIQVDPVPHEGWESPVPGLVTDLLLSLDDRWLYLSNWLHGDIRQYDVRDPSHPRLAGRAWMGGLVGRPRTVRGRRLSGGPQMLQLSLDGKRLYVTNSLFSAWDNQFYPGIAEQGSWMARLACNTEEGGLVLDEDFLVDFGAEPGGPARAHEMRFPGGDCTSDIWV